MKCTKVHLLERTRTKIKKEPRNDKPRRYCQKILVDPYFEEKPGWSNILLQKIHSSEYNSCDTNAPVVGASKALDTDDIFLSVQTLQFKGKPLHCERPRTSFKYKAVNDGQNHRMFVKQAIDGNVSYSEDDRDSEITCYYLKDYAKYFISNDRSRPSSNKSSIFFHNIDNKLKHNKSVQVDFKSEEEEEGKLDIEKVNETTEEEIHKITKYNQLESNKTYDNDSKIAYHRNGNRKSITILKAENPETVQVIRVDVVCNYRCHSSTSNEEFNIQTNVEQLKETEKVDVNLKGTSFGNKYLLTKSIKALDQNVSGGANVTLLCKTFRLADRSKTSAKPSRKQDITQRYRDVNI